MSNENYIGGSWLLLTFSWAVEAMPLLDIIATGGTIVLTGMGIANYIRKWRKEKNKNSLYFITTSLRLLCFAKLAILCWAFPDLLRPQIGYTLKNR